MCSTDFVKHENKNSCSLDYSIHFKLHCFHFSFDLKSSGNVYSNYATILYQKHIIGHIYST